MAARYNLTPEDLAAVQRTAMRLGLKPERLLAVIDFETQGTMNPGIVGGEGGNYEGLIQFGPTERATYGFRPGMTFAEQIEGPVYNYLNGRGLPVNASLSTLYRTINGGNPNAPLSRRDDNGSIAQHIAQIETQSLPRAQALLANGGVAVAGGAPAADAVPLPRVSPTQRAMAQTQPARTEAVAAAQYLPEAQPAAREMTDAALNLEDDEPSSVGDGLSVRVRRGDTLWDMASKYYGDGRRWTEIQAANGGVNPKLLLPGMVLKVPGVNGPPVPQARPEIAARPVSGPASAPLAESATDTAPVRKTPVAPPTTPPATLPPEPAAGDTFDVDALTRIDENGTYINQPDIPRRVPTTTVTADEVPPLDPEPALMPNTDAWAGAYGQQPKQTAAAPTTPPSTLTPVERQVMPNMTKTQKQFDQRFTLDENMRTMPERSLVPSVWERVTEAVAPLFDDAPAAANPAPEIDLTPPRAPAMPIVPPAPTKDQSRIDPNAPSQRQPATRIAPPKDTVSGAERPATSVKDFVPLEPSIVNPQRPPAGVTNLRPTPGGTGGYQYQQSGYAVTTLPNGIATRAPIPTSSSTTGPTVVERWNPTAQTWVPGKPTGGASITNSTTLTPVQQSNAGAALPGRPY